MAKYGSLPCQFTALRSDILTGNIEVTLTVPKEYVPDAHRIAQNSKGKDLLMEISDFKKKRSLDANAYMWVLCSKIADKLNVTRTDDKAVTKEEVYRHNIKELSDNFYLQLLRDDTIEPFSRDWATHGIGWFVELVDECKQHPGYSWVNVYYGSSQYDTTQMSRLIDNIVQDAKALDIETLTPAEIARMKAAWAEYEQKE